MTPSLDTCLCPSSQLPPHTPIRTGVHLPAVPHYCHQQGDGQQAREPSKSQQNCTGFLVQGHPLPWVHSTLPTILSTARLTLPACIPWSSGRRSFCCQERGLSHRLEVFSREWLSKGFPLKPGPWHLWKPDASPRHQAPGWTLLFGIQLSSHTSQAQETREDHISPDPSPGPFPGDSAHIGKPSY